MSDKTFEKLLHEIARKIAEESKEEIIKEMNDFHPKLGSKAKVEAIEDRIVVSVPERPWKFVIFGTRPHLICARLYRQCGRPDPLWKKSSKALAFFWKKRGVFVIARKVRHPGYRPRKSVNELRRRLISIIGEKLRDVLVGKS